MPAEDPAIRGMIFSRTMLKAAVVPNSIVIAWEGLFGLKSSGKCVIRRGSLNLSLPAANWELVMSE